MRTTFCVGWLQGRLGGAGGMQAHAAVMCLCRTRTWVECGDCRRMRPGKIVRMCVWRAGRILHEHSSAVGS